MDRVGERERARDGQIQRERMRVVKVALVKA